jgi:hypothetical protein
MIPTVHVSRPASTAAAALNVSGQSQPVSVSSATRNAKMVLAASASAGTGQRRVSSTVKTSQAVNGTAPA